MEYYGDDEELDDDDDDIFDDDDEDEDDGFFDRDDDDGEGDGYGDDIGDGYGEDYNPEGENPEDKILEGEEGQEGAEKDKENEEDGKGKNKKDKDDKSKDKGDGKKNSNKEEQAFKAAAKRYGYSDMVILQCPHCNKKSLFMDKLVPTFVRGICSYYIGYPKATTVPRFVCLNKKCKSFFPRTGIKLSKSETGEYNKHKNIFHVVK